jgi:hypothetical protein
MDMKQTSVILNEAIERMALCLEQRHWQAFVAERGISYPYTLSEKMKILKAMILNNNHPELISVNPVRRK